MQSLATSVLGALRRDGRKGLISHSPEMRTSLQIFRILGSSHTDVHRRGSLVARRIAHQHAFETVVQSKVSMPSVVVWGKRDPHLILRCELPFYPAGWSLTFACASCARRLFSVALAHCSLEYISLFVSSCSSLLTERFWRISRCRCLM